MTTIVLARHGQTPWHEDNRYTGSSDIDIDDTGQQQAQALARWALRAGITALGCTGLRRSRSTAAAVAEATGLEPTVIHELRELHFGVAEGRSLTDLRRSHPGEAAAFMADPVAQPWPGGDDPAERTNMAMAALRDWAERADGDLLLMVGHNTMIRLMLCYALGIPLEQYRLRLPQFAPGATAAVRLFPGGSWALLHYNTSPEGCPR